MRAHEITILLSEDRVNGKNLIPDQNPRVVAKWNAALQELVDASLLENSTTRFDRPNPRQKLFQITHHGYEVADMIEETI